MRSGYSWLTNGKRFIVLGMGRAGRAAARFLLAMKAAVYGFDDDTTVWNTAAVQKLLNQGLKRLAKPAIQDSTLGETTAIVSPGVSNTHPFLRFLRSRGVPVVDELDFAGQMLRVRAKSSPIMIAVTGTNGKSTTVALIAAILQAGGRSVFYGGNLAPGRPLSEALLLSPRSYYVIEVSSFQLERSRYFAPKVAVILNITPDHLNRHRTFRNYVQAKARILARQRPDDWALLNYDDQTVYGLRNRGRAQKLFFSITRRVTGAYFSRGWLCFNGERVAKSTDLKIPGRHNIENALAAVGVTRLLGVEPEEIKKGLHSFHGLEHRLELVRCFAGVRYVNNSMCTNPRAGVRSLQAFDKKVVLIAGGKEKGVPIEEYVMAIVSRAKWVVLLGENCYRIADELKRHRYNRFEIAGSMAEAVRLARQRAKKGDIVLFSPGFASFDMFRDFQERGRAFKNEVRRLG